MSKIKEFFENEEKRTFLFLFLSAFALLISFLHIVNFKIDIAWVAIILCGFPIVKGAIEGLITEFDIKADVLVADSYKATLAIGKFKEQGTVGLLECKIKFIIVPLLGDHILREANHYLRLLKIFKRVGELE